MLFVIDDFQALRLNRFRHLSGPWPPPAGAMLIERTAVPVMEARPGQSVIVKTPVGDPRAVLVAGLVHDPGLAPAWQEREGYGYVTRNTLALLGGGRAVHELRISLRDQPLDAPSVERAAAALASWLVEGGHTVRQIRVPPPGKHPHQRQMTTVLLLMLVFSLLALVLSSVLVATSLAAILARQIREIAVMKTLGARTAQLCGLYAVLVIGLGAIAFLLALPAGIAGARLYAAWVRPGCRFGRPSIVTASVAIPWRPNWRCCHCRCATLSDGPRDSY
jgi:putative ABC transport system permease protein